MKHHDHFHPNLEFLYPDQTYHNYVKNESTKERKNKLHTITNRIVNLKRKSIKDYDEEIFSFKYIPVSGTSVGRIIRRICSMV